MMIKIEKSPNADSRTANPEMGKADLLKSTKSHIDDVSDGLLFISDLIKDRCGSAGHDHTKLDNMDEFYAALKSGHIKDTNWYRKHITEERHHLKSHVPEDVNLIDVIEHIVDCVMAGLARSGTVYDIDLSPELLQVALQNTVELLKKNTTVVESDDILDQQISD